MSTKWRTMLAFGFTEEVKRGDMDLDYVKVVHMTLCIIHVS